MPSHNLADIAALVRQEQEAGARTLASLAPPPKARTYAPDDRWGMIEARGLELIKAHPDRDPKMLQAGLDEIREWEHVPENYPVVEDLERLGSERIKRISSESEYDIGKGIATFGRAMARLPGDVAASVLSAIRGGDVDTEKGWSDDFIAKQKKESERFVAAHGSKKKVFPETFLTPEGVTVEDVARLPQNIGYTVTSALAGLGVGLPAAAIPLPGARPAAWAAGSAASGAVAYRMAKDQFISDLFDLFNDQAKENKGRDLTESEWGGIKEKFEGQASEYGLWEAIPEAAGQALSLGIIRVPVGRFLKLPGIKNRLLKTLATGAAKFAAMQAEEHATETVTGYGQAGVEADVGLREKPLSLAEAAKAQAAQTFLLTSVMGGAGAVGSRIYDKAKASTTKQRDDGQGMGAGPGQADAVGRDTEAGGGVEEETKGVPAKAGAPIADAGGEVKDIGTRSPEPETRAQAALKDIVAAQAAAEAMAQPEAVPIAEETEKEIAQDRSLREMAMAELQAREHRESELGAVEPVFIEPTPDKGTSETSPPPEAVTTSVPKVSPSGEAGSDPQAAVDSPDIRTELETILKDKRGATDAGQARAIEQGLAVPSRRGLQLTRDGLVKLKALRAEAATAEDLQASPLTPETKATLETQKKVIEDTIANGEFGEEFLQAPRKRLAEINAILGVDEQSKPASAEVPTDLSKGKKSADIGNEPVAEVINHPQTTQKEVMAEKRKLKRQVVEGVSSGNFTGAVRFGTVDEIKTAIKTGKMPVSEGYGEVHAQPIMGTDDNAFAAYGAYDKHNMAMVIPEKYVKGKPDAHTKEVVIDPDVSLEDVTFLIDGHEKHYRFSELQNALQEPGRQPAQGEIRAEMAGKTGSTGTVENVQGPQREQAEWKPGHVKPKESHAVSTLTGKGSKTPGKKIKETPKTVSWEVKLDNEEENRKTFESLSYIGDLIKRTELPNKRARLTFAKAENSEKALTDTPEPATMDHPKKVANMSADDLLAEWDRQAEGLERKEAPPKTVELEVHGPEAGANSTLTVPDIPTPRQKAKETAHHIADAVDKFKRINAILGDEGALSNKEVDPAKWEMIRPLLKEAWDDIVSAGKAGADFVKLAMEYLSPRGRPYFEKFVKDEIGGENDEKGETGGSSSVGVVGAAGAVSPGLPSGGDVGSVPKRPARPVRSDRGESGAGGGVSGGAGRKEPPGSGSDLGVGIESGVSEGRARTGTPAGGAGRGHTGVGGRPAGEQAVRHGGREVDGSEQNHVIEKDDIIVPAGPESRIQANINAVQLVKKLQSEDRNPAREEKKVLAKYVGWGAFSQKIFHRDFSEYVEKRMNETPPEQYFSSDNLKKFKTWKSKYGRKLHPALGGLLTQAEWNSARSSTVNAHYTSRDVISSMWDLARRLGFNGGTTLEPAGGVGHFFGLMPRDLAGASMLYGVEKDTVSGEIFQKLYPQARIEISPFEKTKRILDNSMDLVITNVPFADVRITDKRHPDYTGWSLHNYYLGRSLSAVKPGGVVMAITSAWTLDAVGNGRVRAYLSEKADLLGAIRLPNTAFRKNAGTDVVTDILVLRKKNSGQSSPGVGEDFNVSRRIITGEDEKAMREYDDARSSLAGLLKTRLPKTAPTGEKKTLSGQRNDAKTRVEKAYREYRKISAVNEYFIKHPEMVLGRHSVKGARYASETYTVEPTGDLSKQLQAAIETFPQNVMGEGTNLSESAEEKFADISAKEGVLVEDAGRVYLVENGRMVTPYYINSKKQKTLITKPAQLARLKKYLGVREAAKDLIRIMGESGDNDAEVAQAQKELNILYDGYVKRYKAFGSVGNSFIRKADNEFAIVDALEIKKSRKVLGFDRKFWVKQDIFTERTIFPFVEPSTADNLEDAVNQSIAYKGGIIPAHIGKLLGETDISKVKERIVSEGFGFINPETGIMEQRDLYLSGNVKKKLKRAKVAAESDPRYRTNVAHLEKIVPEDLDMEFIDFRLGGSWLPDACVSDFMNEVLDLDGARVEQVKTDETSRWKLVGRPGNADNVKNVRAWGTRDYSAGELVMMSLNFKRARVMREVPDPNSRAKYEDMDASREANLKMRELSDAFVRWAKTHDKWSDALSEIYNEEKNGTVLRKHAAPNIRYYPNASHAIELREHQKIAVSRGLQESVLMAYGVGTGKTFIYVTLSQEMKRIGTARKPLIVVHNATIDQYRKSFATLYPGAKVLIPGEGQRSRAQRKKLLTSMAAGNWDAIVLPQSFFDGLANDPMREAAYVEQRIKELETELMDMREDAESEWTVKELEKMLEKKKQHLGNLLDRRKDEDLYFEQMGIDALLVDEAHAYKRSEFHTKLNTVKGIDSGSAQKSTSFLLKANFIREKTGGKNIITATGTPISNTMAELWTMLRYVRPDLLEDCGVIRFDDFAGSFGKVVEGLEETPSGFKEVERFAEYVNGPELLTLFFSGADVRLTKDADLNLPRIKNGKATAVVVEKSPELKAFISDIIARWRAWENLPGREKMKQRHVPLTLYGQAKKAAVDLRLIDPEYYPYDPKGKLGTAVENIYRVWRDTRNNRSTQIVFLDIFRDSAKNPGFNAHRDLKARLAEMGIPENEILIFGEAKNESQQEAYKEKIREGRARVIIGSTLKLGIGVDIAAKLVAAHHLNVPDRPMDIEQRNGRILRQGNENPEVEIFHYMTQDTLDSVMFDRLSKKQRFADQVLTGDIEGRSFSDPFSAEQASFSEFAAASSGEAGKLLFEKNELIAREHKYKVAEAAYVRRKSEARRMVKTIPVEIKETERALAKHEALLKALETEFPGLSLGEVVYKGKTFDRAGFATALTADIESLKESLKKKYGGMAFGDYRKVLDARGKGSFSGEVEEIIRAKAGSIDIKIRMELATNHKGADQPSTKIIFVGTWQSEGRSAAPIIWNPKFSFERKGELLGSADLHPSKIKKQLTANFNRALKQVPGYIERHKDRILKKKQALADSRELSEEAFKYGDQIREARARIKEIDSELMSLERQNQERERLELEGEPEKEYPMLTDGEPAGRLTRLKNIRSFLDGDPVAELSGNEFQKDPSTSIVERVAEWFKQEHDNVAVNPELGEVALTKRGVKDSVAHGLGRNKAAAFAAVPDIIHKGILAKSIDNWKGRDYSGHVILAPIRIAKEEYVGVVVVVKDDKMQRFYLQEVALKRLLRQQPFKTGALSSKEAALTGDPAGAIKSLLHDIYSVNPKKGQSPSHPIVENPLDIPRFILDPKLNRRKSLLFAGSTAEDYCELIEGESGPASVSRDMARYLLENHAEQLAGLPVVVDRDATTSGYYGKQHRVSVSERRTRSVAGLDRTLIHETIHGLTARALTKDPDLKKEVTDLLEKAREAMGENDLRVLRDEYGFDPRRMNAALDEGRYALPRSPRVVYGLLNEDEFLSQAFSDTKFQELLKGIRVRVDTGRNPETLWDRFVAFIRKVLGFTPERQTLLEAVLEKGEAIFQKDAENIRQGAYPAEVEGRAVYHDLHRITETEQLPAGEETARDLEADRSFANTLFELKDLAAFRINKQVKDLQVRVQEMAGKPSRKRVYLGIGYQPKLKRSRVSDQLDRAMLVYRDMRNNPDKARIFREWAEEKLKSKISPAERLKIKGQLRILDMAESLTPEQKQFTEQMGGLFENGYAMAKSQGIINAHRDNYVRRLWRMPKPTGGPGAHGFKTFTAAAMPRTLETVLDGWMMGYELRVEGITSSYNEYMTELTAVLANRAFVTRGVNTRDAEGKSLFSTDKLPNYERLKAAGFSVWRWKGEIKAVKGKEGQKVLTVNTFGRKFFATPPDEVPRLWAVHRVVDGVPRTRAQRLFESKEEAETWAGERNSETVIQERPPADVSELFETVPLYAPAPLADMINRMTAGDTLFSTTPAADSLLRFNAGLKSWLLLSSFFHHLAGARSWVFGVHHGWKNANPVSAYKSGLRKIDDLHPLVELGIKNGLTLGQLQDWSEYDLRQQKGYAERILNYLGLEKTVETAERMRFMRESWADSLFKKFFAGLKSEAFVLEYTHDLAKANQKYNAGKTKLPPDPDRIAERVAQLINADFGGLHLRRMGRNPTLQKMARLLLLAPDWSESNFRTVTGMIPGANEWISKAIRDVPPPNGMDQIYRKFWGRVMLRIAASTLIAQVLLNGQDDTDEFVEEQMLSNRFNKFRWTEIDVGRLYEMLGVDLEGQRKTFSLGGHFFDPLKLLDPWSLVKGKGSPLTRILGAGFSGSDWAGRPFTGVTELATTGKTVKKSPYQEKVGAFNRLPAFLANQVIGNQPIQIGQMLRYFQGEADGLTALSRSLGAAVHTAWAPRLATPIVRAGTGNDRAYAAIETLMEKGALKMGPPSRHISINEDMVKMNHGEYAHYLEHSSGMVRRRLSEIMASARWARLSEASRAELITRLVRAARKRARSRLKKQILRRLTRQKNV